MGVRLRGDTDQRLAAAPAAVAAKFQQHGGPKFVYDKAPYQNWGEQLLRLRGSHERIPHPKWSPDFNSPAEHAHAIVKGGFRDKQHDSPLPKGQLDVEVMQEVKGRLVELVQQRITAEAVRRDVEKLKVLWRVVAAKPDDPPIEFKGKAVKGVAGGWAPPILA